MTPEEAITLAQSKWWEGRPSKEVALFQLQEPLLCMPFGDFHKAVEEAVGRPVWTHEFIDPESLVKQINGDEPSPSFKDILDMLPKSKTIVVITE